MNNSLMSSNHAHLYFLSHSWLFQTRIQLMFTHCIWLCLFRYDIIIILIKYGTNWLVLLNGHICFGFYFLFKKHNGNCLMMLNLSKLSFIVIFFYLLLVTALY